MRFRRLIRGGCATLLGLALIGIGAEGVARCLEAGARFRGGRVGHHAVPPPEALFSLLDAQIPGLALRDQRLGYRLRPGVSVRSPVGMIHINAQGFRGNPVVVPKPPGTYRILALGGSTTFGIGVDDHDTYPAQLEALLKARCAPRLAPHIEVMNGGVPGYASTHTLIRLQAEWLAYEPDLVLVMDGLNDLSIYLVMQQQMSDSRRALSVLVPSHLTQTLLIWYGRSLAYSAFARLFDRHVRAMLARRSVERALARQSVTDPVAPFLAQFHERLGQLADLASAHHFTLVIVGYPGVIRDRFRIFAREMIGKCTALQGGDIAVSDAYFNIALNEVTAFEEQWAVDRGIPTVDLRPVFAAAGRGEDLYVHDGMHFSPAGNAVVAEAIAGTLFAQYCTP